MWLNRVKHLAHRMAIPVFRSSSSLSPSAVSSPSFSAACSASILL